MKRLTLLALLITAVTALITFVPAASSSKTTVTPLLECDEGGPLCAETADPLGYGGEYTGHDEPSLLFYSATPSSTT
jgi:hypothetical protein